MNKRILIRNTGENMTPVIRRILDGTDNNDETAIEFEKGEYHFHKEGSLHQKSYSSCGPSTENDTVFAIVNKKNVIIDGNGSEFIFCDRIQPFTITGSSHITLKNFSTDFSFMRYAYADIISVDDSGVEISLDPEVFQYSVKNGAVIFHCGSEQLSTETRKISCKSIDPLIGGVFFLYIGNYTGRYNPAAPNIYADAEISEKGIFLRYRKGSKKINFQAGCRICLAYDNDREMQAFYSEFSDNISLENITIYRQGGMGFVADVCDDITLERFRIMLKPGRHEYFATTADGIFLTNCGGSVTVRNSLISNTYDDAMNTHGYYTEIKEVLSENKVKIGHLHNSHWGLIPFRKDDRILFTDPISLNVVGSGEISDVSYSEDRLDIVVTFKNNMPLKQGLILENRSRMADVLMEENEVIHCPHIRLSSPRMTVRRNRFSLDASDIYVDDLIDYYKEYGAVESLTISENHFGNTGGESICILSHRPAESNHIHENVVIENNTFEKPRESALNITAVRDLTERNNIFCAKEGDTV